MAKIKTKNLIILGVLIVTLVIGFLILCVLEKELPKKSELNVIEETDLSLNIEIDQNDISSYRDFIKNNEQYRKLISEAELQNQIKGARDYLEAHPSGKTAEGLREKIIQELNIGFLLHGLNQRELVVTITAVRQYREYTEKELLFKDPQVGTFSVLLLIPNKEKESYPAIVGLHGHEGSNKVFRDMYFGKELARKGFVVIMPSFRAMGYDEIEMAVSQELYLNGFTLMGLRAYETLLLIKYLKYKNSVDEHKIGIMGHSGGSDTAYLVSRISLDLQAGVYDMYSELLNLFPHGGIHCETIPGLAYYTPQVNDPSTLKIPSRKFEYGYPNRNDRHAVINFFKEKLVEE